jgi:hypothetical protein
MKRVFFIGTFFIIAASAYSQTPPKPVYSGGMLIFQPGYTLTTSNHQTLRDVSFGIGGLLRFYFLDYFTAGIFGGSQKTRYNSSNSENSYLNLGYGGPFLGFSHKSGKFRYTASLFAGKGSIKNLHIEKQNNQVLNEAYWYKYPVTVFSPILSLDYSLSQRLVLTLQTVYLTATYDGDKKLRNPTVQVGILFNR